MGVSVRTVSGASASLEFSAADARAVRRAIRLRFGPMRRRWFVLAAEVVFGGERFAFQNEWNDPCLISSTARGSEMLRQIADDLGA